MKKKFIFDYDDTLAWNQHDYSYPIVEMLTYILNVLGPKSPNPKTILDLEEEIDMQNVKTIGFKMERFPTSFRMTYETLCQEAGIPIEEKHQEAMYNIGMKAFSEERYKEQGLISGAIEVLEFIKTKGDKNVLYTKGDERVQQKKIEVNNIAQYFDEIHIVGLKSTKGFLDIIGDWDKELVYKVGNSIRSDVNPALEAGIKVIYIPCETWGYERQHNGISLPEKVITLERIDQIPEIYDSL
jgi:putative hydrolase of the HAD superfamily